ncbi:MAG: hypothetical protein CEE38_14615 [Planctomycetes bacterium B3_Pla]|nr:MAG: hypothetical protein CEE38_14615 [Planctomycetes bacterium B3_Pla]
MSNVESNGDRIIAEYDAADVLLLNFIYSPGIDEPICLTVAADGNAVYHQDGQGHYYHFDGLGSVRVIWGQHTQFKTEMSKMSSEFDKKPPGRRPKTREK